MYASSSNTAFPFLQKENMTEHEDKNPLSLANRNLDALPDEVCKRFEARPISWLELTENKLSSLPPKFYSMVSVHYQSSLSSLPMPIQLVRLDLEKNQFASLPDCFGSSLASLQSLNLRVNQLTRV